MKKNVFSWALAALVLAGAVTSCTNSDDEGMASGISKKSAPELLSFSASAEQSTGTRAYAVTAANAATRITSFQVWGYDAVQNALYMGENASTGCFPVYQSTGDYAGKWTTTPVYYWPVNALNFVAVSPATYAGVTGNTTSSTSGVVSLTSDVVIPTDVEVQEDLMYAEGNGVTQSTDNGNMPLAFKHALSQIIFKGKISATGSITKVSIKDITLGNVANTASIPFTSTGVFYGGATKASVSNPVNFKLDASDLEGSVFETVAAANVDVANGKVLAGTPFDLTISEDAIKKNAWMLLPQSTTAATIANGKQLGGTAPVTGAYLKISARLEKNGVVVLNDTDPLYLPLTINWDRGVRYIYTIEFNGEKALTPITFTQTAVNWVDADPQPGDISM